MARLQFYKRLSSLWQGRAFYEAENKASGKTGLLEIMKKGFGAEPGFLKLGKSGFSLGHTLRNHENRASSSAEFFKTFKSSSHPYCLLNF